MIAAYASVLSSRWARFLIICVFFEAALLYAVLSFIGADLHLRFGLGFTLIGIVVGFFAVGGLIYTFLVSFLVNRLGQIGLVIVGGLFVSAGYLTLVFQPVWWLSFGAMVLIGLGFYMVHNTFQTNATQMAPQARGTALALFSSVLYAGITVGVAVVGDRSSTATARCRSSSRPRSDFRSSRGCSHSASPASGGRRRRPPQANV